MSHKTCIKMLIVVNTHFPDSTPIRRIICNLVTIMLILGTRIGKGSSLNEDPFIVLI